MAKSGSSNQFPTIRVWADVNSRPTAIAIDDTSIYFTTVPADLHAGGGMVMKVAKNATLPDGPAAQPIATDQLEPGSLAVSGSDVFWINGGVNGTLMKGGINPGDPVTQLASGNLPGPIAVDASNVYWANFGSGEIMKVAREGGTPVTVASGQASRVSLAVDASRVYWVTSIAGGAPVALARDLASPYLVTVDATDVYFAVLGSPGIQKVSKTREAAPEPAPFESCGVLLPRQGLVQGAFWPASLSSCDGADQLTVANGVLKLQARGDVVWLPKMDTGLRTSSADRLVMRDDGDLVLSTPDGAVA